MPIESFERIQVPFVGRSMWPLLKSGEALIVQVPHKPVELSNADIGKLFIFKDNKEWVCHRYLGLSDGAFLFKGDFSTVHEALPRPHVLGEVLGFRKNNKHFYFFRAGRIRKLIVRLQKSSITGRGWVQRLQRYLALILALTIKPLFYRKVDPLNIVSKSLP